MVDVAAGGDLENVSLEIEAMKKEYEWIIINDLPKALAELGNLVKTCLEDFPTVSPLRRTVTMKRSPSAQRSDSISRATRRSSVGHEVDVSEEDNLGPETSLVSLDGGVLGEICLTGSRIMAAKLRFNVSARVQKPMHAASRAPSSFETQISPARPLVLPQLVSVVNNLDLCLLTIEDWSSARKASSGNVPAVTHVNNFIERIVSLISCARDALVSATPPRPEDTMGELGVLNPPPHPELLLTFYIESSRIVVRSQLTTHLSHAPSNPQNINECIRPRGGIGYVFLHKDRWFEVVSRSEGSAEYPLLVATLANLNRLLRLANRLQDKMSPFGLLA